jgi:acyl carrier protein
VSENESLLLKAFSEGLGGPESRIADVLTYNSIPEWDSVAHMVLISSIEEKFGIMLDTNEILDLSSVAQARKIVSKHGVVFS